MQCGAWATHVCTDPSTSLLETPSGEIDQTLKSSIIDTPKDQNPPSSKSNISLIIISLVWVMLMQYHRWEPVSEIDNLNQIGIGHVLYVKYR